MIDRLICNVTEFLKKHHILEKNSNIVAYEIINNNNNKNINVFNNFFKLFTCKILLL